MSDLTSFFSLANWDLGNDSYTCMHYNMLVCMCSCLNFSIASSNQITYTHTNIYPHTEQHEDAVGCPNKWNPFHECNSYCTERWGEKVTLLVRFDDADAARYCLFCVNIGNDKEHSDIACQLEKSKGWKSVCSINYM